MYLGFGDTFALSIVLLDRRQVHVAVLGRSAAHLERIVYDHLAAAAAVKQLIQTVMYSMRDYTESYLSVRRCVHARHTRAVPIKTERRAGGTGTVNGDPSRRPIIEYHHSLAVSAEQRALVITQLTAAPAVRIKLSYRSA